MIDMTQILPIKPSESKLSVENYDEKTAENYRNCYVVEKRIASKLSKILISNFNSANQRLGEKGAQEIMF